MLSGPGRDRSGGTDSPDLGPGSVAAGPASIAAGGRESHRSAAGSLAAAVAARPQADRQGLGDSEGLGGAGQDWRSS